MFTFMTKQKKHGHSREIYSKIQETRKLCEIWFTDLLHNVFETTIRLRYTGFAGSRHKLERLSSLFAPTTFPIFVVFSFHRPYA